MKRVIGSYEVRPRMNSESGSRALREHRRGGHRSEREGQGLTFALAYHVTDAIRSGAPMSVLTAFEPDRLPVHLVYPAGSSTSAKLRAFVELATPRLRDEFQALQRAKRG